MLAAHVVQFAFSRPQARIERIARRRTNCLAFLVMDQHWLWQSDVAHACAAAGVNVEPVSCGVDGTIVLLRLAAVRVQRHT